MILSIIKKNLIINLLLVFLIFLFDRISKIYVIYLNNKFLGNEIFSSKFLNITLIWNEGIAFGIFSFEDKTLYNFLTILIFTIILAIALMVIKSEGLKKYSLLMILSGALGNIFDRIYYKAVPDFIDIHIGNFHWFIFNIADIFITLGVVFMIFLELFVSNKKNKSSHEIS